MGLKVSLTNGVDKEEVEVVHDFTTARGKVNLIAVADLASFDAAFFSATRATAGTTILAAPAQGGVLSLTDLLISTDKTNATSVTVRLTDDINTIDLFVGDSTNAPLAIGHSFTGYVTGWQDARLEMVTVGAVTATVTVVYIKKTKGIPFADWDARR